MKVSSLPNSLLDLEMGKCFNHPISCLPDSITFLSFGYSFNSSPFPLPSRLKTLLFGDYFNQPLQYLPAQLHTLKLGHDFNQLLPPIPNSLTCLKMDNLQYEHKIDITSLRMLTQLKSSCISSSSPNSPFRMALIGGQLEIRLSTFQSTSPF